MKSITNFVLEREAFHQLYLNTIPKKYCFQVGSHHFYFSFSQVALLSLNAFQHFIVNVHPFVIQPYSEISNQVLLNNFKSLVELFHNQSELIIDENNVQTFTYLAQTLDNVPLLIKCLKTASTQQIFTLSSKSLRFLPHHYKKSLNDFSLIINGQTFKLNYSLLCCLCEKFQQMESPPTELSIQVPNEHLKCFIHFLNIFNGISFNFQLFSFSSLFFLIDLFGISNLFQFISSSIPFHQI
jgi:hypothetical protein